MDLGFMIGFFLKNRVNRHVFSYLARKEPGRRSFLEDLLSAYTRDHPVSWTRRINLLPFHFFFEVGRLVFGQTRKQAREKLSDPIFQHGIALTMRSIGKYGLLRPQIFTAPPVVVWNFTNRCNLKCKHCYQDAGRKLLGELTLEQRLDVVEQLAEQDVFSIAYSGGEPLMDKDLWAVVERGAKHKLYQSIATNGTLIDPRVAEHIADCGVNYVEISLDSTDPQVHDTFRGIPGLWERTVTGIKNAVTQEGFQVGIAATITQINFPELEELIQFTKDIGADKFYAFNFIPAGRGKAIMDMDLSPQQREEMLNILYDHFQKGDMSCMTTAPQYARVCMMQGNADRIPTSHYSEARGRKAKMLAEFIGGCGVGRAYCSIQPDGEVTPCVFMPIPVGNLREHKFADIWANSPILKQLRTREDLDPGCGICQYRSSCGGCRARAYGYFGNFKAADPGCINNKDLYDQLRNETLQKVAQ